MSSASVSYNFVNATIADATQVSQNFTDLVDFINGQIPHSDGTGGTADPRGVLFGAVADRGKKVLFGVGSVNLVSGNSTATATINFSPTFGSNPSVLLTVHDGGYVMGVTARSVSSITVEIRTSNQAPFAGNASKNFSWMAIG
jgi:hypothetical protein